MKHTYFSQALSRKRPGAALLILVLVMGAVSIAIGTSIALGSIGELSMGFADAQSKKALSLADSCAEEALLRLGRDSTYAGATLTLGDGSCIVTVTTNGANKNIDITATVGRWIEHVLITADISGSRVSILDWRTN